MILLLFTLAGCDRDKDTDTLEDTGDPVVWETGEVVDTSGPDTDTDSATETAEPDSGAWIALRAAPDDLVVNPGASWTLSASAEASDGTWTAVDVSWSSSDPTLVSVDAGVATALAPGAATITATLDDLSATLDVTVNEALELVVTLVDAETGALLPGGSAVLDDGERVTDDDEDGDIVLTVPDGAPVIVTGYIKDYAAATIWGAVSREIVLPLRSSASLAPVSGEIVGAVDFDEIPTGEFDRIRVGMAAPSIRGSLLLVDLDSLVAEERTLELYGVETDVPANLYVNGFAEDYAAQAEIGPTAVWTLAGALPIADLLSGLDGTNDVFELLQANRDVLVWGWSEGGEVSADATLTADLAPGTSLDATILVDVGALPGGFSGDEEVLVLSGQQLADEGLLVTGFGIGSGEVDVASAPISLPDATGEEVVVLAQVGGLGSGGALCATTAPVEDGLASPGALPEAPTLSFAGETRSFSVSTDTAASFVHVAIESSDGTVRDLYLDGGAASGILPQAGLPFGYGRTTWSLVAVHAAEGTFDGFVASGSLDVGALAEGAAAAARLTGRF